MSRSLSLLKGAVRAELGDVSELVDDFVIERALNEGQRMMEPAILLEQAADLSWLDDAESYSLPNDYVEFVALRSDLDHQYVNVAPTRIHAGKAYFARHWSIYEWSGTLFYRAHFPTITPDQTCLLPDVCADGLVSYALHRCFKRIATNRTDYRRYSTMVNNASSVADLLDLAQSHLDDYANAVAAGTQEHQAETFYGGE